MKKSFMMLLPSAGADVSFFQEKSLKVGQKWQLSGRRADS